MALALANCAMQDITELQYIHQKNKFAGFKRENRSEKKWDYNTKDIYYPMHCNKTAFRYRIE